MTMADRLDWLRLYRSEKIGPASFFRLIERYRSAGRALEALPDLAAAPIRLCSAAEAEREFEAMTRIGASMLIPGDPGFPDSLRILEIAPILIILGDPALLIRPSIAIVGARDASAAGRKMAQTLAADIGSAGLGVVSGLARGIDTAAHRGGLATGTAAVVAGGVDHVYPPENAELQRRIAAEGCIVSEMPPGHIPKAQHFPRRNRLISALSLGVVVVEAMLRSGSLITARFALEQGREVFAVPGSPLDPRAHGPNSLIKQGAQLVENAGDILEALEFIPAPRNPQPPAPAERLDAEQHEVERLLTVTAVTVDEILRQCQLSPSALSLVLLQLELAGRLIRHPDQTVSLRA